jgi:zinc/manganese transport system permease protein
VNGAPSEPHLTWNLLRDAGEVLEYHFMVNALLATGAVAVAAGVAGWLMVLRREAFAGHTLSVMAFPGASGAALAGVPAAWGYYVACSAAALAIARLRGRGGARMDASAGIALVQTAGLAAGFVFLSLYGGVLGDLESQLFGTFLGVSDTRLSTLAVTAVVVLAALAAVGRPLLFASVDPAVAAARGVRVPALESAFLLLLGLVVAATSQVTGALLVFSLLLAPAASAQALTARPATGLALSVALALLTGWLGLAVAYFSPYPAGVFIASIAFALYLGCRALAALRARGGGRPGAAAPAPAPGEVLA